MATPRRARLITLGAPRRARLITLVALDIPCRDTPPIDVVSEVEIFGFAPREGSSEGADTPWRPRITDARGHDPASYRAPHAGSAYTVLRCHTAVVHVPMANNVLYLDLEVEADLAGIILAEKDAFDPAVTLTVDDVGLLRAAGVSDGALTGLRRQILILHGAEAEPLLGSEPVGLSDDQERLLRQLVFKDTDITYRAALAPVSVPADINGPDLQSVFVWDTNTVVEGLDGYPALEKPRILGFALSNCQIVGAIARCEAIRLRTVTELVRDRPPEAISADQLRDATESLVRTIASLRQDLDLGVEMHLLSAGIAGGRPLRQYHESIAAESDLPHLLKITRHLLNQLLGALRTDQELRGLQEARETAEKQLRIAEATQGLLDQTDAFKAATVIFASVAAVLGLAGLFAQAMAIPAAQQDTLLRSVPGGLVFTLVTVAVAVTLGLALRFAAKRAPRSTRARRWTRRLRWAAVLATGVAVAAALAVVLGHGPADVAVTLVTAAIVGALTAVFCIALEFDFEAPQDR